ncbi:Uncharacterised protein [Mycobacteroides abscessus subsp. abscessus]|nr:Uncharacterised protein [Mycobacteroides abscessus subsp. abscessus]
MATDIALMSPMTPLRDATTVSVCVPSGRGASGSPPCAAINCRKQSIAVPSARVWAGSTPSMPATSSISRASATVSATTSSGPPPARTSSDSATSTALPTARPSGRSMSVSSARVGTP